MMKRYIKNLLMALMGRNPFQRELKEVKEAYEETAKKVTGLSSLYKKVSEEMDAVEKQQKDYQTLVENYRERLKEKDELIVRMKEDYQQRLAGYNAKIDELQRRRTRQSKHQRK